MVANLAKHYGLDMAKIQLVNLAPPEQLSSLATGAIDGVCVWQPWVQLAGKKISVDVVHTGAHSSFAGTDGKAVNVDVTRGINPDSAPLVKANTNTNNALMRENGRAPRRENGRW